MNNKIRREYSLTKANGLTFNELAAGFEGPILKIKTFGMAKDKMIPINPNSKGRMNNSPRLNTPDNNSCQ